MPIISGTVEFTTPRPFEAKSARVALNFTIPDGLTIDQSDQYIAAVGLMARAQALNIASDNPAKVVDYSNEPVAEAPAAPPTPPARGRRAAAAPPPAPVSDAPPASAPPALLPVDRIVVPPPPTPPAPMLPPTVSASPPAPMPPPAPPGSTTSVPAPPTDPLASMPAAGLPVHLTDEAINNAILAKLGKYENGTPARQALVNQIKQLRAEYTGGLEILWASVQDAEKRSDFLARLSTLA
jgi:hypothetical protein